MGSNAPTKYRNELDAAHAHIQLSDIKPNLSVLLLKNTLTNFIFHIKGLSSLRLISLYNAFSS